MRRRLLILGFVIFNNVFEFGGAAKVIPPGLHPGRLLGSLAQGKAWLAKSERM